MKEHRVLVVEDEPDSREGLRLLLERKGYLVDTAENGLQALQILKRRPPPCLVLLDLMMPEMSGWELCAELRKHERLADIPIVILSALSAMSTDVTNVVARMTKPVDLDTLYDVLESNCAT